MRKNQKSFNVYLDKDILDKLDQISKKSERSRTGMESSKVRD